MDFYIGQKIDRYIVEGRIGEGGMAEVYKCRHESLNTFHAIKVVKVSKEEVKQRMIREGQLQATLSHNNIVRVTDILPIQGHPCLVMDFIEGQALDEFLADHRIGLGQAEEIFIQIVDAMSYAHDRNIIHRDLKPANILMELQNGQWTPKVADFGLAKALGTEDEGMTRTGIGIGTPAYMAPEQVRNAKGVDHRADIFSLGTILYEMLTGQLPFNGSDTLELLNAVANRPHRPPKELFPQLPDRMAAAINSALIKDAEKRVQTCEDLKKIFSGEYLFVPQKQRHDTLAFDGSDFNTSGYNTVEHIDSSPPLLPSQATIEYNSNELIEAQSRSTDPLPQIPPGRKSTASSLPRVSPKNPSGSSLPQMPQRAVSEGSLPQVPPPDGTHKVMNTFIASQEIPQKSSRPLLLGIFILASVVLSMGYYVWDLGNTPTPETGLPPIPIGQEGTQESTTNVPPEELDTTPYPFLPQAVTASHGEKDQYPQSLFDDKSDTTWSAPISKQPTLEISIDATVQHIQIELQATDTDPEHSLPKDIEISAKDSKGDTLSSARFSVSESSKEVTLSLPQKTAIHTLDVRFLTPETEGIANIGMSELKLFMDTEQAGNTVEDNRQALIKAMEMLKNPPPQIQSKPKKPKKPKAAPKEDPVPEPEAAPTPQVSQKATVTYTGADSFKLILGNQSFSAGSITPGSYQIIATFGDRDVSIGTQSFEAGKKYQYRCTSNMSLCQLK